MISWHPGWWWCGACVVALGAGCAHNHGNTYAYAPPYAPPVYPQPGTAQPVSYAVPVQGAAPPVAPGVVVAGQTTPCPQACADGTVVGAAAVVEEGQTPPCPPGP